MQTTLLFEVFVFALRTLSASNSTIEPQAISHYPVN